MMTYGGNIFIGNDTTINISCIIYGHGDLIVGNNVLIAAQTVIIPANHNFKYSIIPIRNQGITKNGVMIDDNVWIGSNVCILDGTHIKEGTIIGAGAVVTRNTEPYSVYAGVPAKKLYSY